MALIRSLQFCAGIILCAVALALPYRARTLYIQALGAVAHFPYRVFGRLTSFLLAELKIDIHDVYPTKP